MLPSYSPRKNLLKGEIIGSPEKTGEIIIVTNQQSTLIWTGFSML